MSAELVDPFATHEPGGATASPPLTADEWYDIRNEVRDNHWDDHALIPELLTVAMEALRDIACRVGNPHMPSRAATQCLRQMAYRAKTGVPFNEPQEPAWSLDRDEPRYHHVLGPDELEG